jgi:hypothetical protein
MSPDDEMRAATLTNLNVNLQLGYLSGSRTRLRS